MKYFVTVVLFFCSLVSAQEMRIKMKDGSLQIVPLQSITKITFTGFSVSVNEPARFAAGKVLTTLALLQNYPNPFNPSTTIAFTIPRSNSVTVRIFDITGRLVTVLLDEHREAGECRIVWNGKNSSGQSVASGLYLYEVRYEGVIQTRKMMMLK